MTVLDVIVLAAAVVVLVGWLAFGAVWLHRRMNRPPARPGDLCETCGAPATHELADQPLFDGDSGGFTAMVATYCADHAPDAAVPVG